MSALPTRGPWSAHSCDEVPTYEDNGVRFVNILAGEVRKSFIATRALSGYIAVGKNVASVWRFGDEIDERDANAALIAEAGTVYHETGLTPRDLADQRAELLAALRVMIEPLSDNLTPNDRVAAWSAKCAAARAVIAKAGAA